MEVFSVTPHRKLLLDGLERAMKALHLAGCKRLYMDGSFVSAKPVPGDYDGCWEPAGVDGKKLQELEPTLLRFEGKREPQKSRFGGELFISNRLADSKGTRFVDFFQFDRDGKPKGIVAINL